MKISFIEGAVFISNQEHEIVLYQIDDTNIFEEGELDRDPTISKIEIVQNEGGRIVN